MATKIPGTFINKPPRWVRQPDELIGRVYRAERGQGFLLAVVSQDEVEPAKILMKDDYRVCSGCGIKLDS